MKRWICATICVFLLTLASASAFAQTNIISLIAYGDTGENNWFYYGYNPTFNTVDIPYEDFGFYLGQNNGSHVQKFRREFKRWDECGVWYVQIKVSCDSCVFQTGDEIGGFPNISGFKAVRTFMKRGQCWERVCMPDDEYRMDYFGFSSRGPGGNGGARVEGSIHDGKIWYRNGNVTSLNCPLKLNTGAVVSFDNFNGYCWCFTWDGFSVKRTLQSGGYGVGTTDWTAFYSYIQ